MAAQILSESARKHTEMLEQTDCASYFGLTVNCKRPAAN